MQSCLAGPGATAGGTGQWTAPPTPPPQGPKVNPFLPKADGPSQQTPENGMFQQQGLSASSEGQRGGQVHR